MTIARSVHLSWVSLRGKALRCLSRISFGVRLSQIQHPYALSQSQHGTQWRSPPILCSAPSRARRTYVSHSRPPRTHPHLHSRRHRVRCIPTHLPPHLNFSPSPSSIDASDSPVSLTSTVSTYHRHRSVLSVALSVFSNTRRPHPVSPRIHLPSPAPDASGTPPLSRPSPRTSHRCHCHLHPRWQLQRHTATTTTCVEFDLAKR